MGATVIVWEGSLVVPVTLRDRVSLFVRTAEYPQLERRRVDSERELFFQENALGTIFDPLQKSPAR